MTEATHSPGPPHWFDRLTAPIPKLEHEDRKSLVARIELGAAGGVDFVVMMCFRRPSRRWACCRDPLKS